MRAIRTYVTALHRLVDDFETSYTLLVAAIESLAQGFDGFRPEWADYDEQKRRRIDRALAGVEQESAELVRQAILDTEHVAMSRRFCDFTLSHLPREFYREDAAVLGHPVSYSDLKAALPQAYRLRSEHLHRLETLPALLTLPLSHPDSAPVNGRITLTFQGLARVARQVITQFIRQGVKTEKETYDYRRELAGIVHVSVAPQYWIWKADSLATASGRGRLQGFLEVFASHLEKEDSWTVPDLREMLSKAEGMFSVMTPDLRRPFLALYFIYNRLILRDNPMENFGNISEVYASEVERPSVEFAFVHLLSDSCPDWPLENHHKVHDDYFRNKRVKDAFRVPRVLEAALSLQLAERYRIAGETEQAKKLVAVSLENCPGHTGLLHSEEEFDPNTPIDWTQIVPPYFREDDADDTVDQRTITGSDSS